MALGIAIAVGVGVALAAARRSSAARERQARQTHIASDKELAAAGRYIGALRRVPQKGA
jgi:hypothetical protein